MKRKKAEKKSFYEEDLNQKAKKSGQRKDKASKRKLSIYDTFDEDEEDDLLEHYRVKF